MWKTHRDICRARQWRSGFDSDPSPSYTSPGWSLEMKTLPRERSASPDTSDTRRTTGDQTQTHTRREPGTWIRITTIGRSHSACRKWKKVQKWAMRRKREHRSTPNNDFKISLKWNKIFCQYDCKIDDTNIVKINSRLFKSTHMRLNYNNVYNNTIVCFFSNGYNLISPAEWVCDSRARA